jgi:putative PIN family toxin of toxin-antitoxin system
MRIVLDSNILLVVIGKRSLYRPIWTAFISGKYNLIVSDDVIYEYEEILQQRASPGAAAILMDIFIESSKVIYQQIYYSWHAITLDPDDNKFFDIAVAGNADYLVTNDAHFNILKQLSFPSVKIITADEFLAILDQE